MLKPAILYKEQIEKEFLKKFYTQDMFYETGCLESWVPDIKPSTDGYKYEYAIVNSKDELIGFLSYCIDRYADSVSRFGLISFDKGNSLIGIDVGRELERLVNNHHRVEWRMIGGNPVEKHYDKFCKKHMGVKHVLRDATRDADGNWHDDIIYEIIKEECRA